MGNTMFALTIFKTDFLLTFEAFPASTESRASATSSSLLLPLSSEIPFMEVARDLQRFRKEMQAIYFFKKK